MNREAIKLLTRLIHFMKREKKSPADVALDISLRGVRRVSYQQVRRWQLRACAPHTKTAAELGKYLAERGY